jgi:multiple sugar transport system permease protein
MSGHRIIRRNQETVTGWLMALPAILLLLTFLIIPFFMAFTLSFTNQRLVSPNPTEYVGLRNFTRLLTIKTLKLEPLTDEASGKNILDEEGKLTYPKIRNITRNPENPELKGLREYKSWYKNEVKIVLLARDVVFLRALRNTFIFVLVIAPLQGGTALLLALMLNKPLRGINIFRAIYFMPVVVSMVVVSLLWRFIYDGENGLLNTLLNFITFGNFKAVDWIGNTRTALPAIIFMSCWQGVGFHMVIWLSGLQSIPASLYEAGAIDGANGSQQFRYITWPGLRNTMVFVLLIITMQSFGLFTQIDVMTRGGPLDSTQSVIFQAVERGYGKQDIAGGSAISVIFFLIVLTVSIIQRYLTRDKE